MSQRPNPRPLLREIHQLGPSAEDLTDALNEEADLHDLGTQLPRRRRKFIEEIINTLSPETLGDMQELVDGDVSVTDILTILDADPAYVEAMAKLYANKTLE